MIIFRNRFVLAYTSKKNVDTFHLEIEIGMHWNWIEMNEGIYFSLVYFGNINNNNMRILERFAMHLPFFPSICVARLLRLLLLLLVFVQLINSSIEYSVCTSEKEPCNGMCFVQFELLDFDVGFVGWFFFVASAVLPLLLAIKCLCTSTKFKPRFGLTKQNKTKIYSFNRTNWLSMVQHLHMIHTESERQYVKSFHRP